MPVTCEDIKQIRNDLNNGNSIDTDGLPTNTIKRTLT